MSTVTQVNPGVSMQEQSVLATQKIRSLLGINDLGAADLKRLSAALSVAAADEMEHNRAFVSRVKALFAEMAAKKQPPSKKSQLIINDDLVPIATGINYEFNPFAPPDPFFLAKLYGISQLPKALSRYSATRLREVTKGLIEKRAAPKLKTKATKEEIIDYIVAQVTRS